MTLQDDIARIRSDWGFGRGERAMSTLDEALAAGLERENIIIPKADLPKVELRGDTYFTVDGGLAVPIYGKSAEGFRAQARHGLAAAEHLEAEYTARESEAAALEARRDELAQDLTGRKHADYSSAGRALGTAIDRLIAAEAEVARLTKEAGK